jgi:N-acetylneuraminate synthase
VESGIASIDAAGRKLGSVDVVSIYSPADLRAGDTLTRKNVRAIRPGFGLPPKHLNDVLGKTVKRDVKRGTALDWSLL